MNKALDGLWRALERLSAEAIDIATKRATAQHRRAQEAERLVGLAMRVGLAEVESMRLRMRDAESGALSVRLRMRDAESGALSVREEAIAACAKEISKEIESARRNDHREGERYLKWALKHVLALRESLTGETLSGRPRKQISDVYGFLSELDLRSLRAIVEAARRVAGPWAPNEYDPNHQWRRDWLFAMGGEPPGIRVLLDDHDDNYCVYGDGVVHSRHARLEEAKQAADAELVRCGWFLFDE